MGRANWRTFFVPGASPAASSEASPRPGDFGLDMVPLGWQERKPGLGVQPQERARPTTRYRRQPLRWSADVSAAACMWMVFHALPLAQLFWVARCPAVYIEPRKINGLQQQECFYLYSAAWFFPEGCWCEKTMSHGAANDLRTLSRPKAPPCRFCNLLQRPPSSTGRCRSLYSTLVPTHTI